MFHTPAPGGRRAINSNKGNEKKMNDNVQMAMDGLVAAVKQSVLQQAVEALMNGSSPRSASQRRSSKPRRKASRRGRWHPGSRGRVPAGATSAQIREHRAILKGAK